MRPVELQTVLRAHAAGHAVLVGEAGEGVHVLDRDRLTVGRGEACDVALPGDAEVSRLHAELERVAGAWTVVDDGLSRNGTWVGDQRVRGRVRLRDGDVLRVGRTALAFRAPPAAEDDATAVADAPAPVELTPAQLRVLAALAAPLRERPDAAPASNGEIAEAVVLSVDAVKAHLRALFARFGLDDLPQGAKRLRLAEEARRRGLA